MIILTLRILRLFEVFNFRTVESLSKILGNQLSKHFILKRILNLFFLIGGGMLSASVESVSSGSFHNLIRKSDGSLLVMGANDVGQLGDATDTNRPNPIKSQTALVPPNRRGKSTVFLQKQMVHYGRWASIPRVS